MNSPVVSIVSFKKARVGIGSSGGDKLQMHGLAHNQQEKEFTLLLIARLEGLVRQVAGGALAHTSLLKRVPGIGAQTLCVNQICTHRTRQTVESARPIASRAGVMACVYIYVYVIYAVRLVVPVPGDRGIEFDVELGGIVGHVDVNCSFRTCHTLV